MVSWKDELQKKNLQPEVIACLQSHLLGSVKQEDSSSQVLDQPGQDCYHLGFPMFPGSSFGNRTTAAWPRSSQLPAEKDTKNEKPGCEPQGRNMRRKEPAENRRSLTLVTQAGVHGTILAHCNLHLLDSRDSPASASWLAGTKGAHHNTQVIFEFSVEMKFHQVGQVGLKLLTLGDPSTLASHSAGNTGVSHCIWLVLMLWAVD
uniref:Uncharacterized protein n=1 Tax=Papio anubis TaxID=9555 RepID=A0A8I5R5J7_PAPAN